MEAPEKVYFNQHTAQYNHERRNDDDIEYIRTDAFIDKACKWLKDNITYIHPRKGTKECIVNLTTFKEYMKGE